MGEYTSHSVCEECSTTEEILERIFDHALITRKRATLSYRPHTVTKEIDMQQKSGVNFEDFYPDFAEGDSAWMLSLMDGMFERDMLINVRTNCDTELYFNGERQSAVPAPDGTDDYFVRFRTGQNRLLIKATARAEGFAVYVAPLVPELRYGTGGDYAYCTWQYIEKEGFRLQAGYELSRLYQAGSSVPPEESAIDWVYPQMPPQSNEKTFSFQTLCGEGYCAYAYTYVQGTVRLRHDCPMKIFSEGRELYCSENGEFCESFDIPTPLLIKTVKKGDNWGFFAETDGQHSLPFVDGADCPDLQWLWVGPFGRSDEGIHYPYAPEKNLQFEKPYPSIWQGMVYWHCYRNNTYLKQYLHSAFFGQWFYAIMVGHYGMLQAAKKLGKISFYEYFTDSIRNLCAHREYGAYDNAMSGYSTYMANGGRRLTALDPIGTIGINVSEYYMMTGDENALCLLRLLAESLKHNVPRFPDGTFYRKQTMWTDDTYMCLPFLVRLGIIMKDESYFDEILTQVRGFYKRLYMEEENLFSHIFFVEENKANRVPWGRGNGWVLLALSEVLTLLPQDYHGREEILSVYQKFAAGVLQYRDKKHGMWHQVVNNPESYLETSGSAMFIIALARGVRFGWIASEYQTDLVEAWEALTENCIDTEGNVYGVCKGSGCNMEEKYYLKLGTMINDDHGVGIVLHAGSEIMNMLHQDR